MIALIKSKIEESFAPLHLEIVDESSLHANYTGNISHLKVILVSEKFNGQKTLKRHQAIYSLLKEEMTQLHALSLHLHTEEEWADSPNCRSPRCHSHSSE